MTEKSEALSSVAGSTIESAVERLMREQLQTMNQLFAKQLEALRGVSPEPAAAKTRNESPAATATPVANVSASPAPSASAAHEPREFNLSVLTNRRRKEPRGGSPNASRSTSRSSSSTVQTAPPNPRA